MKRTVLLLAVAGAVFAQQIPDDAAKKIEDMKYTITQMSSELKGAMTFEFVGGTLINGKTIKGAPYSGEAVTEMTQTLPDGNRIVHKSSSMQYRDSDGRERREEAIGRISNYDSHGEPSKTVFISDPVAKVSYTLDVAKHTAQKNGVPSLHVVAPGGAAGGVGRTMITENRVMSLPESHGEISIVSSTAAGPILRPGGRGGSSSSNAKVEQLGKMMFDGVEAEGTRTTMTIPAGQIGNERPIEIVDERWYSNELQMTVMSKHNDPRTGETTYKLNNINRTEPLRSLFEVPADYTVNETPEFKMRVPKKEEIF
jgi:hypothetical protein